MIRLIQVQIKLIQELSYKIRSFIPIEKLYINSNIQNHTNIIYTLINKYTNIKCNSHHYPKLYSYALIIQCINQLISINNIYIHHQYIFMQQYNLLSKMKNQSKLTSSNTPFKIKEQLNRESIQQQQFSKDNLVDSFLSPWESKKINEYNFKEMPKNLVQGKIKSQRIFSRIKNTENDAVKRFEKRYKIYDGDKITKKNELNFIRSPIKITKENVRSNILELKRQLTPQKTYYQTNYAGQLSKYHNHNKSQSLNKFNRVKGNQDSSSYIKKYCLSNADLPNNHTFDLFMIPRKKNQIQSQNTKVPRNKVANILRRRIQSRVQRNTKELTIGKVEIDLQNLLNQENKFRILNTSHHQQRIFSLDLRI